MVYLKQRHYNPVLGRFYQPDPVTFIMKDYGQTNRYQYGWNDSYTYVDSTGGVPLPIITGAIGGVVGGGVSLAVQIAKNQVPVNWTEVVTAAGIGAVAGAVSPWTATTVYGAIVTGATANSALYSVNQRLSNKEIKTNELMVNAATGAIGGGLGGTVISKLSLPLATNSLFISKAAAQSANNGRLIYANVTDQALYRNILANIVTNDPFSINSMNLQLNSTFLNSQNKYQVVPQLPTIFVTSETNIKSSVENNVNNYFWK